MEQLPLVSTSPHVRDEITTDRIMWAVTIALLPAAGSAIYFFGLRALILMLVSVATAVLTEYGIQKWRKVRVTALDGSAVITGLLLALIISSEVPVVYVIFGSFFSIAIGKQVFGGLGMNIWNPALVGRAFMQLSFAIEMNSEWALPRGGFDTVSGATPLSAVKEAVAGGITNIAEIQTALGDVTWIELIKGNIKGCMGETSAVALIIGGLFLIGLKIVDWKVPFLYIGSAVLFCWMLPIKIAGEYEWFASDPAFHLFSGGLLLGGFFMMTDMVTSPVNAKGRIIFALGGGLLVGLIRILGGYPEGVCYSILIMNTAVPLIDKLTMPKPFGTQKKEA